MRLCLWGCLTCDGAHQQARHDRGQCPQQREVEVGQRVPGVGERWPDADAQSEWIQCTSHGHGKKKGSGFELTRAGRFLGCWLCGFGLRCSPLCSGGEDLSFQLSVGKSAPRSPPTASAPDPRSFPPVLPAKTPGSCDRAARTYTCSSKRQILTTEFDVRKSIPSK